MLFIFNSVSKQSNASADRRENWGQLGDPHRVDQVVKQWQEGDLPLFVSGF